MGGVTYHYGRSSQSDEWSEEELKILTEEYRQGTSYKNIAEKIPGRTKNSVSGRISRMKRQGLLELTDENIRSYVEKLPLTLAPLEPLKKIIPGNKCMNDTCINPRVINLRGLCSICDRIWIEKYKKSSKSTRGLHRRPGW